MPFLMTLKKEQPAEDLKNIYYDPKALDILRQAMQQSQQYAQQQYQGGYILGGQGILTGTITAGSSQYTAPGGITYYSQLQNGVQNWSGSLANATGTATGISTLFSVSPFKLF